MRQEAADTMTILYEIREQIKYYYGKYDMYIRTLLKFVMGLFVFFMINAKLGFMSRLDNFAIPVLLSLLCSFLPVNCMVLFAVLIVLVQLVALSLELAVVAAVILLMVLCLCFILAAKVGYLLVLTPLLFALKMPYVMPIVVGLVGTPLGIVPVSCGVVAYYIMHFATANAATFQNSSTDAMADRIKFMMEYMIGNKEMMLTIVAFAIVLALVYILRRTSMDYAWYIAIGAGALANILIFLIGDFAMDISNSILGLLVGTVLSVAAALVVQFFVFSVDYAGTRKVQFEDDEYYYYVKAVPKITISAKDKQVKEIHSPSGKHRDGQRARRQQEHSQAKRRPRPTQSAEHGNR